MFAVALRIYISLVYPFCDGHSFVQVVAFKKPGLVLIRTVSPLVLSSVWCVLVDGSSHITAVVLVEVSLMVFQLVNEEKEALECSAC